MRDFWGFERPRSLIVRLVRAEPFNNEDLYNKNANRVSFEFDGIDADLDSQQARAAIDGREKRPRLALLKILTTANRFRELSDVPEFADGQWYRIKLGPRKEPRPLAWFSPLGEAGYETTVPVAVGDIRFLFAEGEPPLRPVGAAVEGERDKAQAIADACNFPESAKCKSQDVLGLLSGLRSPHRIIVRDVGQASFASALDQHGNELFHLDAGWPISYNKKTTSVKPVLKVSDAPVILSHWDWDHLHGYYAITGLSKGTWMAPVQKLGPGAKRVAQALAKEGRLLGVRSITAGPLRLRQCKGKAGSLNQTGLCVQVSLRSGKTVLFMGDADYNLVPASMAAAPHYLIATHHGAKFAGTVMAPHGGAGECVVSVGKGNGYGHPSETAVSAHEIAKWTVKFTCHRNGTPRGSRYLGP